MDTMAEGKSSEIRLRARKLLRSALFDGLQVGFITSFAGAVLGSFDFKSTIPRYVVGVGLSNFLISSLFFGTFKDLGVA